MRKINLITTSCKRCGKEITTTDRSISGADEAKRKYGSICSQCITPEEKLEILDAQAKAILK